MIPAVDLLVADIAAQDIVHGAVQHIWTSFEREVDSRWLDDVEVELAVERSLQQIREILHVTSLKHDVCAAPHDAEAESYSYALEDEPAAAIIDRWARGAVPVRKPKTPIDIGSFDKMPTAPSEDTRTRLSWDTSRNSGSVLSSRYSKATTTASQRTRRDKQEDKGYQIMELDEDQISAEWSQYTRGYVFPSTRTARHRTASSSAQSAEASADTARPYRSKKATTAAQAHSQKKERHVTYDLDGTAVPLEPVPPEKLPPYSHTPNVSVKNATTAGGTGGGSKQNDGDALGFKRSLLTSARKQTGAATTSGGSSKPQRSNEGDSLSDASSKFSYFRAAHSLGAGMSPTSPAVSSTSSPIAAVQHSQAVLQAPSTASEEEPTQSPAWDPSVSSAGGAVSLPVLPDKPGTRQRQMATGLLNQRNPRDRVHPAAKKNTADYSRLPPPPVGQTTGHGFQIPSRQPGASPHAGSFAFSKGPDSPQSISSAAAPARGIVTQVSPAVVKQLLS